MHYRNLGRAGVSVSRLGLGTMNFGVQADEETSFAVMDRALELGVNFFDTANVYGGWHEDRGATEAIIGRWLKARPSIREDLVLGTKVYSPVAGDDVNGWGLSAFHTRRAVDDSLRRLQTDYIDLYQFHHVDRRVPWEETWQAIDVHIGQGKITYVGTSNSAGWHLAQIAESAAGRAGLGPISEQSLYNLAQRSVELEVLAAATHYGLGVLPWSPLAGGLLSGALRKVDAGRTASWDVRKRIEALRPQLERFEAHADELGLAPSVLALAWLLHQPAVTAPIIGPRTAEQLEGAVSALDVSLDGTSLRLLDDVFPGAGGAAPEAYAW